MAFDALARSLAAGHTRRRLVAALAAIPLAGSRAERVEAAGAEKPRGRVKRRKDAPRRQRRHRKHHSQGKGTSRTKHNGNTKGGKLGDQPGTCALNGGDCRKYGDCCAGPVLPRRALL